MMLILRKIKCWIFKRKLTGPDQIIMLTDAVGDLDIEDGYVRFIDEFFPDEKEDVYIKNMCFEGEHLTIAKHSIFRIYVQGF